MLAHSGVLHVSCLEVRPPQLPGDERRDHQAESLQDFAEVSHHHGKESLKPAERRIWPRAAAREALSGAAFPGVVRSGERTTPRYRA